MLLSLVERWYILVTAIVKSLRESYELPEILPAYDFSNLIQHPANILINFMFNGVSHLRLHFFHKVLNSSLGTYAAEDSGDV